MMKQDTGRGRPLLTAAIELLTDLPTQVFVSGFRAAAGDPRQADTAAHYQSVVWSAMRPDLQAGRLVAVGFVDGSEQPKVIHPQFFDSASPDLIRSTLASHGVTYNSVRIFEASQHSGTGIGLAAFSKGGRAPEHGDEFIQELLRFAIIEDCPSRKVLTDHMKVWCESTRGDGAPVDRTIERWVERYWPRSLPTK